MSRFFLKQLLTVVQEHNLPKNPVAQENNPQIQAFPPSKHLREVLRYLATRLHSRWRQKLSSPDQSKGETGMFRILCKSKIHRATVTDANLNYEGSLTLDPILMEAAGLVPFEQVHVLNLNNGARFETYLIEGERGSGTVCVNGAAARLVQVGDLIIVLAYALVPEEKLPQFEARIVFVDEQNKIVKVETAKVVQGVQVGSDA